MNLTKLYDVSMATKPDPTYDDKWEIIVLLPEGLRDKPERMEVAYGAASDVARLARFNDPTLNAPWHNTREAWGDPDLLPNDYFTTENKCKVWIRKRPGL